MQMQERRTGNIRGRLAPPPRSNLSTEETVYSAFDRPGNIVDQRQRRLINAGPCHYCH